MYLDDMYSWRIGEGKKVVHATNDSYIFDSYIFDSYIFKRWDSKCSQDTPTPSDTLWTINTVRSTAYSKWTLQQYQKSNEGSTWGLPRDYCRHYIFVG